MRSSGHLTERLISKLPVGLHHDGERLYAQVTLGLEHNVSWVLRYTLPEKVISKTGKTRNKERRALLGRYPAHHTYRAGFLRGLDCETISRNLPCRAPFLPSGAFAHRVLPGSIRPTPVPLPDFKLGYLCLSTPLPTCLVFWPALIVALPSANAQFRILAGTGNPMM